MFALFSGWYFWMPKIMGLDYNILLSKVHFWILFIGVRRGIFNFYQRGKRFNHQLPGGSPNDNFVMFFKNVKESKKNIYKELRRKSSSQSLICNRYVGNINPLFNRTSNTLIPLVQSCCQSGTFLKSRYYSSLHGLGGRQPILDPNWVTGFVDAEGSFSVLVYKTSKLKMGWETQLSFNITLHTKDLNLLIQIKSFFCEVGIIKNNKGQNAVSYTVTKLSDLVNIIIPHFNKYFLISQKRADFILFSSVVDLVKNKEHLSVEGLNKILAHKASMNRGLSRTLVDNFTNIIPVERIKFQVSNIPSNWVAGFVSGEGSFYVVLFKNNKYKTGYSVQLRFVIGQHSRDLLLIEKLVEFFGCGYLKPFSNKSAVCYAVTDINSIVDIIIPFFNNYTINGSKNLDYSDFCKIAYLIKDKAHLTEKGLNQIKELASGMNLKRESDFL